MISERKPPPWIRNFLSHFLDERLLESSLGDLEEKYSNNIHRGLPVWRANLTYMAEALGFVRMLSTRKEGSPSTFGHIIHSVIFFTRLVRKDKSYYLVSMFGFTLSLTTFLFIATYVVDELSYDKMHANRDRIFRISTHIKTSDVVFDLATTQFPAAHALQSEFPEIQHAIRLYPANGNLIVGENRFEEEKILYVDENFFGVFSFPFIYGEQHTALSDPGNIILTKSASIRYFGTENPVGRYLKVDDRSVKISGVIDDIDKHSHLKFEVLLPLSAQLNIWKGQTGIGGRENQWFWIGAYTYLQLREPGDEVVLAEKLPVFVRKYFPERFQGSYYELQKLEDIHLTSHQDNELEPGGDILYVRLFSALAVVIIVVSTINLINLSYFKIADRLREMSIRKFLGLNSGRVVSQLSIENIMVGVISFASALLLSWIFQRQFNLLVDKYLYVDMKLAAITFVIAISISLAAIAKPSGFLLNREYCSPGSVGRFRSILVGLQVGLSFVLLVFSFVVSSQIDFFKTRDLGFDKSNVVVIHLNEDFNHDAFKTEMKKNTAVVDATRAEPPGRSYNGWRFVPEGGSYEKPVMLPFTFSDEDFLSTMRIKLLAGRNFSKSVKNDSIWPFLVNKRAAIELGWADDAIGRQLEVFAPGRTEIMGKGEVIGIIDDYHSESLHDAVKPVVITSPAHESNLLVRVDKINAETMSLLEGTWKRFSQKPFNYEVLDQQLRKLYANEEKLGNVMLFFTFVAIYLTCYGMFAMSSLLFSSKLKEVAIRKVFGAGEVSIMGKFYGRYALFNIVAVIAGLPVAIWLGDIWLETFPYHVTLSLMFFLKAALLILIGGIVSVSYYLAKVAWSDPLPFLRRQ